MKKLGSLLIKAVFYCMALIQILAFILMIPFALVALILSIIFDVPTLED